MSKPDRQEPPPQNELERLMYKAADDPALQGRLFRMLWESELFTFIPDHPELYGEFPLENGDSFSFVTYWDEDVPFVPVFTSEAAADYAGQQVPPPVPAIAALPGEAFFKMVNDGKLSVRVNHGLRARIKMPPEAVAALVEGKLTHARPPSGRSGVSTKLQHLPAAEVPFKLRQAIRVFCAQRRVPIGVYVFNQQHPETGAVLENDIRIILWLRDRENDFYNDFHIMVQRLCPRGMEVNCATVTAEDVEAVAFLQGRTPLWPIV